MDVAGINGTMAAEQRNKIADAIKLYSNRLFGFIKKRVASNEDAEDILQDVFYEFEWTLPSGADLPTALTIKLRDASVATSGFSGIRINLAYGKTQSQEPFAFATSLDYLVK